MPQYNTTSVSSDDATMQVVQRVMNQKRDRAILALLIIIACLRSVAVVMSPLGLGVDEAQYWLWSLEFDFGYYTKPPLTSWIIGLSHMIFGHHEWAVRLPAPWLHLATALVLWRATNWLYGHRAGRWAALFWTLLPLVTLGSFVISTDTPMLLCSALGLLAIAAVLTDRISPPRGLFLAGVAVGVAMLAKYAAIYFALSVLAFALWERAHGRRDITIPALCLFIGGMILAVSPNLAWNLTHDFTTVRHLGDNANLAQQSYSAANVIGFLGAQFGVAGPAAFALMLTLFWPPFGGQNRRLLISFALPPLLVISVQAFLSEANANWAAAALPAFVIWLAHWVTSPGGVRWGLLAAAINGGIAMAFVGAMIGGHFGPLTPASDPLRHLRAWDQLASDIAPELTAHEASVIVADRRATAALLSWHFYDDRHSTDAAMPDTAPVTITVFDDDGIPSNHFEQNLNWTPDAGRRLLALTGATIPPALPGVTWQAGAALSSHQTSTSTTRDLYIYRGIVTGN